MDMEFAFGFDGDFRRLQASRTRKHIKGITSKRATDTGRGLLRAWCSLLECSRLREWIFSQSGPKLMRSLKQQVSDIRLHPQS